jgi:sodium/bile acid cotransporter 7
MNAGTMMLELLLVLILPVAGGQLLRLWPRFTRGVDQWKSALGVLSQLLILVVVLKGSAEAASRLRDSLNLGDAGLLLAVAVLSVAVHLTALTIGWFGAKWLGFDRSTRVATAFGGSQKSAPVALLLFEQYLQVAHPLALVPVICYHAGQLIVDTMIADRLRAASPRSESYNDGVITPEDKQR